MFLKQEFATVMIEEDPVRIPELLKTQEFEVLYFSI